MPSRSPCPIIRHHCRNLPHNKPQNCDHLHRLVVFYRLRLVDCSAPQFHHLKKRGVIFFIIFVTKAFSLDIWMRKDWNNHLHLFLLLSPLALLHLPPLTLQAGLVLIKLFIYHRLSSIHQKLVSSAIKSVQSHDNSSITSLALLSSS